MTSEEWVIEISAGVIRLKEDLWKRGFNRRQAWRPNMDVYETGNGLEIHVELAGVLPSNIQIFLDGNSLVIRGVRLPRHPKPCVRCHQLELQYGEFEGVIVLPVGNIQKENIKAHLENGILIIYVPRKREYLSLYPETFSEE